MAALLEYVGSIHIFLGPYRGNPVSLYLRRMEKGCQISPRIYPWNDVVGLGETPNKAAADFEDKWKGRGIASDMYDGPNWEGGIKPERPAPPKPAVPPKPATASTTPGPAPAAAATEATANPPAAPIPTPAGTHAAPSDTPKAATGTPPASESPAS